MRRLVGNSQYANGLTFGTLLLKVNTTPGPVTSVWAFRRYVSETRRERDCHVHAHFVHDAA
jgi:hypothetical protein